MSSREPKKKHVKISIDELLAVDSRRRELLSSVESKKTEQNKVSDQITKIQDPAERQRVIAEMKELKTKMQVEEEELKEVMKNWQTLMLQVPNIPDMSVPEGETDADNKEVKAWGEKPQFTFEPKDHLEIMTTLGMVDFERGAKVHGFRGHHFQYLAYRVHRVEGRLKFRKYKTA